MIVFPTVPVILPPRKCNSSTKSTVNSFSFPYFLFVRMSDPMQLFPSTPSHLNSCRLYASSWMVYKNLLPIPWDTYVSILINMIILGHSKISSTKIRVILPA